MTSPLAERRTGWDWLAVVVVFVALSAAGAVLGYMASWWIGVP